MTGPIKIAILANGSQAKRELGSVQRQVSGFGRVGKTAALAGFGALAYGAVSFAKSSVAAERQFSTSMRLIQASTGASGDEIKELDKLAIKLGQDTSFSANEAAGAMLELAKAGLDTKTIMGGGLAGTLTLAAAGGTDLATASTIASNAMNTFNLRGEDMAKVAAALAGGANASTASVESLGQGLQQVGPGATNAGLSLQETVAALSAFDAAGIKGSDAGTSLKTMLTRLVPATDKAQTAMEKYNLTFTNADGSFKSLTEVAGQLRTGLSKLSDEERTRALATIFGSDATRAATVLMKEGSDGIRGFIKATQDSNAAQDMAKARMSGTEGALEKLSGSIETAQLRLGQELAPAIELGADLLSDKLVPAIETGIDAAKDIGRALAPAAEEIAEALGHLAGEGDAAGHMFNDLFIPALRTTAELAGALVDFIDDLPGPVKEFGVQVGVAALVLPRLNTALLITQARLTPIIFGMGSAAARTAFFSATAKKAAGIGGLLFLADGLTQAADKGATFGSVLQGAAGGAGIGAMFGPIGALVGAGAGAGLTALIGAFGETEDEARQARLELQRTEGFQNAKDDAAALRDALAGVVNQYGKVTRAAVEASFLGEDGKLDEDIAALRAMGVSMDTIVAATLGQRDAQAIVNDALNQGLSSLQNNAAATKAAYDDVKDGARDVVTATGQIIQNGESLSNDEIAIYEQAWKDAQAAVEGFNTTQDVFNDRVHRNTGAIADHRAQMRQLAADLGIPLKRYKDFPKEVRTRFEAQGLVQTAGNALRLIGQYKGLQRFGRIKAIISAPGVELSAKQVRKLQERYKLTPKEVRTLYRLEGISKAERDSRTGGGRVKRNLQDADVKGPVLKGWVKGIETAVREGASISERERKLIVKKLEAVKEARPDLTQYVNGVKTAVNNAAREGGQSTQVGNALKSGLLNGMYGTSAALSAIMSQAVRNAIAAARAAARSNSPSKETEELGRDLGLGLVIGMKATGPASRQAGKDMIAQILAGVVGGSAGIGSAIDKIRKLIEARTKDDKAGNARQKQILKNLDKEFAALKRNGKAQDQINRKLQKAQELLAEVKGWADQVKQTFIDTGNITQLGQLEDGSVSSPLLADQLRDKVARAERFADLIRELSDGEGVDLSQEALAQLLAAGPEAGLATAEALAAGGDAALQEINDLTDRLAATGQALGSQMSDQFFDVGLQAAQGLVDGLKAKEKDLDRIATRLANQLANAIRRALGIKSPSRVFREIGDQTMKGLAIGLDETYAKKAGLATAEALVNGFGTPALDAAARASAAPGGGSLGTFRIHLTAEQHSAAQRGRGVMVDVAAAQGAGARRLAVSSR